MRILAVFVLLLFAPAFGMCFDFDAYAESSLDEATASLDIDPRVNYWLDASHPRYQTTAHYTGRRRPINTETRKFIEMWVKSFKHPPSYVTLFREEVEIRQGSSVHWMPIQHSLSAPFFDEVQPQERVRVFVLLIGALEHTPVFTISSFTSE